MSAKKNESGLWELTINEQKFEFEMWGAMDATETALEIFALLGVPISAGMKAFFGSTGQAGLDAPFDPGVVGTLFERLAEKVGSERARAQALIVRMSSYKVSCNGKAVNYDLFYKGRLSLIPQVFQAALEVQFSSFFDGSSESGGFLRKLASLMTPASGTSTGSSSAQS